MTGMGWYDEDGLSSRHSREGGNLVVLDTSPSLRWGDVPSLGDVTVLGWRSFAGMTGIGWYDRVTEKESSAGMTG